MRDEQNVSRVAIIIFKTCSKFFTDCLQSPNMPNQIREDLHKVDDKSFPYIFEENATIPLKTSEGLVRCNVYRPKTDEKVPVLVTYGPYGKDIYYDEYAISQPYSSWFDPSDVYQASTRSRFPK